jgi:alanyl-tRNA synthetase
VTRKEAYKAFKHEEELLKNACRKIKAQTPEALEEKIAQLQTEMAELRKENELSKQKAMLAEAESMLAKKEEINGIQCLFLKFKDRDNGGLKAFAENMRNRMENSFVFLANEKDGKVTFVAASSKAAIAKGLKAGDLVKKAAQLAGGNGGGRPDMAQAGGKDASKIDEAIALLKECVLKA